MSLEDFFKNVTWGQIVATAAVATIFSILTTLVIEYCAKPSLEVRKYKKLRNETQIDEIVFRLEEVKAALILIVEFSKFKSNGIIIPTHQHMLSQQLKHIQLSTEQIQQHMARLPRKHKIKPENIKKAYEAVAGLEAAAIKTKFNVDEGEYREFKNRNQRVLANYLPMMDETLLLLGGKNDAN
jgi:hypothetical protein